MTISLRSIAMDNTKPWYLSRTIWASLVTVSLSILGAAGVSLEGLQGDVLAEAVVQLMTAFCGLAAIIGRVRATNRIG